MVHSFDWEPAIVFAVAVFAVIGTEFSIRKSQPSQRVAPRDEDRKLFGAFLDLLPSDGAIHFIDEHNMAGWSFDLRRIEPIDRFIHEWNNAEHEFIDVDLQHAKDQLMAACVAWSRTIATETFHMDNGQQSVPPDWEDEQPERFDRVVQQLHEQAQEIVDNHRHFVRLGRRRLLD